MFAVDWTSEKTAAKNRGSLVRRIAYGPMLILALCIGSSGELAAALLLWSIFEF